MTTLTTKRLRLEPMTHAHLDGLHAMNADPEVMRYISGHAETREQALSMIERVMARWKSVGYSWWAFVEKTTGEVIGAGCIQNLRKEASPEPDPSCPLEIGWRLRRDSWHQGLASEAARAMAEFAFRDLAAGELYAVCDPENTASAAVMARLGMHDRGIETWYGKSLRASSMPAGDWHARPTSEAG